MSCILQYYAMATYLRDSTLFMQASVAVSTCGHMTQAVYQALNVETYWSGLLRELVSEIHPPVLYASCVHSLTLAGMLVCFTQKAALWWCTVEVHCGQAQLSVLWQAQLSVCYTNLHTSTTVLVTHQVHASMSRNSWTCPAHLQSSAEKLSCFIAWYISKVSINTTNTT